MGVITYYLSFLKDPYVLDHHQFLESIRHFPIEALLWTRRKTETTVLPLRLTFSVYIHESWTLGKPYGINLRCYWEHLGEPHGKTLGTRQKQKKSLLAPSPPSPPKWVWAEPSHRLHETFISKIVCHHFWPGLMMGAQTIGYNYSGNMLHSYRGQGCPWNAKASSSRLVGCKMKLYLTSKGVLE
jgi:hypothetical protein